MKIDKEIIKKIIGIIIDVSIVLGIVLFIFSFVYDIASEKLLVNAKVKKSDLTQEDLEIQTMEVIAEKVYNAYIERDAEKVNSFSPSFVTKSQEEIEKIANELKVDADKVDAKALAIYEINDNAYKLIVTFKDENDISWQMDTKKTAMIIKVNRNNQIFKIVDMKVGV